MSNLQDDNPQTPQPADTNNQTSGNGQSDESPVFVTVPAADVAQLEKDAAEYKDKYLRMLADMDNMRKRLQKERQELIQYSVQNIIVEFLHPIDHLENALKFTQQMSEDTKHWALGFQMILDQFKDVLANHGVLPFQSEGTPFDPHRHEAVEMIETTEYPPGTVVEESLRGYKMGNKTVRPARVKVAKPPGQSPGPSLERIQGENP